MFGSRNQYATITQFKVRGKDAREQDKNHTVEVIFEMPLTHELAEDILPAMAKDLFNKARGNVGGVEGPAWEPKPEVSETTFNILPDPQVMEVKQHPELDPVCRQGSVTVRMVTAHKSKAGTWLLSFTAGFILGDDTVVIQLIRNLKQGVYLSFDAEEPKLDLQDQTTVQDQGNVVDAEAVRHDEPADSQETQTGLPNPAKPRGRGRGRKALGEGQKQIEGTAPDAAAGDEPAADAGGDAPQDPPSI